ncbi:hypothetical protein [uncultured Nocardioides sp.]|uniref:hypothetical protein n=1 Tax=uncultured Nocardioides sp. TaxID=198441 RepID=UPI00261C7F8A|nr:hypothetical protein [uncultured Nocardioides sp.]
MALDQITNALVEEFLEESGTSPGGIATDFERFCAHVLVSPQIDAPIDYENVMTGDGGDTGLDTVALVINGELVTDTDEIDALAAAGTTLDASYIFIQSKTATSFSTAAVGQIAYGVTDFFSDQPTLQRNDVVEAAAEVSRRTIASARLFRNGNPTCTVYYVTAGRWADDNDVRARIDAARSDIDNLNCSRRSTSSQLTLARYSAAIRACGREPSASSPSRIA